MSDENKLDQAAARAVRAQHLLDTELLAEAFKGLEDNYTAAWRATAIISPPSSPTANWRRLN